MQSNRGQNNAENVHWALKRPFLKGRAIKAAVSLYGNTSQKTAVFIVTTMGTSGTRGSVVG
jgi:hypothetical protein